MPTRVVTPAASGNWTDLASVKLLMEETSSERDVILARLIRDASSRLGDRAGFVPGRQQYEESVRGCGRPSFYLTHRPVDGGSLSVMINSEECTDWVLQDASQGLLWRQCGWPCSYDGSLNIVVTYHAGFLMPDQVRDWSASDDFEVGEWVRPSTASVLRFECVAAGTTGDAEPSWPTTAGETQVDGTATWAAREAEELPERCQTGAVATVLMLDVERGRAGGLASWELDGASESYFATQTASELPPGAESMVARFRAEYGPRGFA
jgi:hypothetical protein